MISDLETALIARCSPPKRRGGKPKSKTQPTALFVAGEAPRGFWVVTDASNCGQVVAVLTPRGLTDAQRGIAIGLTPEDFAQSQSLAMAWNLADVWCDPRWRGDMQALATKVPVPFPKAQRLLFA